MSETAAGRLRYPPGHWLRSGDAQAALERYLDQQSKAYSRVKNRFFRELLGDMAGRRVLDFGCGGGLWAVEAALAGAAEVLALDAEDGALDAARLLAARRGAEGVGGVEDNGPRLRFRRAGSLPGPGEFGRFDLVLLKDVLEHLADDRGFLSRARRLLAPGGSLVIATQNAWSLNFLLEGGYHRLWRRDRAWFGWDPTHLRFYSPRSLRRLLREAGLSCRAWRGAYLLPYKLPAPAWSGKQFWRVDPLSRVDRLLGRIPPFNQLGWCIMLRAVATAREPG